MLYLGEILRRIKAEVNKRRTDFKEAKKRDFLNKSKCIYKKTHILVELNLLTAKQKQIVPKKSIDNL